MSVQTYLPLPRYPAAEGEKVRCSLTAGWNQGLSTAVRAITSALILHWAVQSEVTDGTRLSQDSATTLIQTEQLVVTCMQSVSYLNPVDHLCMV